jgi:hypothetical protein
MNKTNVIKKLISDFSYPETGAQLIAEKIEESSPGIQEAFQVYFTSGEFPIFSIEGYTLQNLMSDHGMNPIAALLTLDWLVREPEQALKSLERGHDDVNLKTEN